MHESLFEGFTQTSKPGDPPNKGYVGDHGDQVEGEVVAAVRMALRAIEERITLCEKWLTMRAAVTVLPPREPVNRRAEERAGMPRLCGMDWTRSLHRSGVITT